jgi:hypothetical protein
MAAVGPTAIVEAVNVSIMVMSKTGATLVPNQQFPLFFAPIYTAGDIIFEPNVLYDEGSKRFYVGAIEAASFAYADFDLAVSKTSDPTQGWYFTKITAANKGQTEFTDYPRMGYNSDAIFVSFLNYDGTTLSFKYNTILTITKNAALLAGQAPTTSLYTVPSTLVLGPTNMLLPANMHGDSGGTEYFVQMADDTKNQIGVITATNYLTAINLTPTILTVAPFTQNTPYPGDTFPDDRMLSADWRGNMLVAAHTVGLGARNLARWYEFSTSGTAPTIVQQGNVKAGTNMVTTYPSIALGANGQIGMTFVGQSATSPMSMEITGWQPTDPLGSMEAPTVVAPGLGTGTTTGNAEGFYSSIQFDATDGTFWAANEYQLLATGSSDDWGTSVVNFKLKPVGPVAAGSPPASQNKNPFRKIADAALIKYLTTK